MQLHEGGDKDTEGKVSCKAAVEVQMMNSLL